MSALRRPVVQGVLAWAILVAGNAVESFWLRSTVQPWWSWALLGTAAITVSLLVRPRYPPLAVALVGALAGGYMVVTDGLVLISYVAAVILISYLVGRRAERTAPVVVVAVVMVVVLTVLEGAGVQGNVIVFMGLPWLSGRYLRQVARNHSTEVEQAQLQERARIAREMHDSLGHELSLIAVRAGALEVAPGLSDEHQGAAGAIRSAAAAATERLGQIVGVLRSASENASLEPTAGGVEDLVDRARESGMDVRLEGSDGGLAPLPRAAARRIVQESLTNAARHAPGSAVTVAVETEGQVVRLSVTNGRATMAARPRVTTRLGLAGLAEAARTAGGTLRHRPTSDGGFELVAELPRIGESR